MRKLLLFFIAALALLCGCASPVKDGYEVMVLGDLHYDGMEYHTSAAVSASRAKERVRNCTMWKEATPKLLEAAAKNLNKDTPFIIQAGDFTQGDCDTFALHEKMIRDGFAKVKSYFPNHKFLPVRGNHDIRMLKGNSGVPTVNAFFPLIAKELGVEKVTGTYTVRHGKDLYIFFDGFLPKKQGINSLKKALADNPGVRYTFFITHLPVLNCSVGNPAWLVRDYKAVRQLLLERNAIIITAHTHVPSLIQAKRNGKQLTQVVLSSVGKDWVPGSKPEVNISGLDNFCKAVGPRKLARKSIKASIDDMRTFELPVYELDKFKSCTGFAKLKVSDAGVSIEFYTDGNKPAMVKKLR